MASLRQQIYGIIDTCKTAIAAKGKDPMVDGTTLEIARAALAAAKAEAPNDKVLAAINLDGLIVWTGLLTAMQIVESSLPQPPPPQARVGRFSRR